jgi:hypothetical protein
MEASHQGEQAREPETTEVEATRGDDAREPESMQAAHSLAEDAHPELASEPGSVSMAETAERAVADSVALRRVYHINVDATAACMQSHAMTTVQSNEAEQGGPEQAISSQAGLLSAQRPQDGGRPKSLEGLIRMQQTWQKRLSQAECSGIVDRAGCTGVQKTGNVIG